MKAIIDIETDALQATKIHCIVVKDIKTKKVYSFVEQECYDKFPEFAKQIEIFIGHNFVKFDAPILNQLTGTEIKLSQVEDTLIMSQLANPERWHGHSLAGWGKYLKFPKHDQPDFSKFTPEMLTYCKQDVDLTEKVYYITQKELRNFSEQSIRIEHRVFHHIGQMCRNGVGFNEEKAMKLYAYVKEKAEQFEKELRTHFSSFPNFEKTIEPKRKRDGSLSVVNRRKLPEKNDSEFSIIIWKYFDYEKEAELKKFLTTEMWKPNVDFKANTKALKKAILKHFKFSEDIVDVINVPENLTTEEKHFSIVRWEDFNPASHLQVVRLLNNVGWKPYVRTKAAYEAEDKLKKEKITPEKYDEICEFGWKVNEANLNTVPESAPQEYHKLALYKMVTNREAMLRKQYFPSVKNGRIYGEVFPLGAVTNRMTHRNPNLANIPAVKEDENGNPIKGIKGRYGYEMRELFCVPDKDYVMLGTDADQLELRALAHDMQDQNFIHTITTGKQEEGTDVHSVNQKLLELPTRKQAKTFIYAFIYGAGNAKIGNIIDKSAKEGGELKDKFFKSMPKLLYLFNGVRTAARKNKKIRGLDGRILHVRKEYSALNTRIQSSGAIICKYWLCNIMEQIRKFNLDAKLILAVHDEYQFEVHKKDVETLKQVCIEAMKKTGEQLNMRLPLVANVKEGRNWAETH